MSRSADPGFDFVSRYFAPAFGIDEDPVTGSTHCCLAPFWSRRLLIKPGMTGWAQVNGLRGQTSLDDRVEWDNYYIENWSLWLDLKILLLTVRAMVRFAAD